jgi:hypothetical protein
MRSRTSPIVVAANALRAAWQLVLGTAVILGAIAALSTFSDRFDPLLAAARAWLVQLVTG